MAQRTSDISRFTTGLQSRAEMLISLRDNIHILTAFESLYDCCTHSICGGGKIIICGNGGFAAIAQHTASELVGKLHIKRNPIPAIALGTDVSVLTCIANDFGYERIFSRQLEAYGNENDVLITLSTSGKSKNILQALSQASKQGIKSVAFTGYQSSSLCKELGADVIEVPSSETEAIQDATMVILHLLCSQIEFQINEKYENDSKTVWSTIIDASKNGYNSALILDRDGVVNHLLPNDYISNDSDLSLNADFLSVASSLRGSFKRLLIVTNQACIGKGSVSEDKVRRINSLILKTIGDAGGKIDDIYTCADADASSINRKPNIGLADIILKDYPDIDFTKSIVVGDSFSDELFAKRLGAMYFNIYNI